MPGARWSNCYLWAKWQQLTRGGHLIWRRSDYQKRILNIPPWWPHYMWSQDLVTFYAFVPAHDYHHRVWFPMPLFRGRVESFVPSERIKYANHIV